MKVTKNNQDSVSRDLVYSQQKLLAELPSDPIQKIKKKFSRNSTVDQRNTSYEDPRILQSESKHISSFIMKQQSPRSLSNGPPPLRVSSNGPVHQIVQYRNLYQLPNSKISQTSVMTVNVMDKDLPQNPLKRINQKNILNRTSTIEQPKIPLNNLFIPIRYQDHPMTPQNPPILQRPNPLVQQIVYPQNIANNSSEKQQFIINQQAQTLDKNIVELNKRGVVSRPRFIQNATPLNHIQIIKPNPNQQLPSSVVQITPIKNIQQPQHSLLQSTQSFTTKSSAQRMNLHLSPSKNQNNLPQNMSVLYPQQIPRKAQHNSETFLEMNEPQINQNVKAQVSVSGENNQNSQSNHIIRAANIINHCEQDQGSQLSVSCLAFDAQSNEMSDFLHINEFTQQSQPNQSSSMNSMNPREIEAPTLPKFPSNPQNICLSQSENPQTLASESSHNINQILTNNYNSSDGKNINNLDSTMMHRDNEQNVSNPIADTSHASNISQNYIQPNQESFIGEQNSHKIIQDIECSAMLNDSSIIRSSIIRYATPINEYKDSSLSEDISVPHKSIYPSEFQQNQDLLLFDVSLTNNQTISQQPHLSPEIKTIMSEERKDNSYNCFNKSNNDSNVERMNFLGDSDEQMIDDNETFRGAGDDLKDEQKPQDNSKRVTEQSMKNDLSSMDLQNRSVKTEQSHDICMSECVDVLPNESSLGQLSNTPDSKGNTKSQDEMIQQQLSLNNFMLSVSEKKKVLEFSADQISSKAMKYFNYSATKTNQFECSNKKQSNRSISINWSPPQNISIKTPQKEPLPQKMPNQESAQKIPIFETAPRTPYNYTSFRSPQMNSFQQKSSQNGSSPKLYANKEKYHTSPQIQQQKNHTSLQIQQLDGRTSSTKKMTIQMSDINSKCAASSKELIMKQFELLNTLANKALSLRARFNQAGQNSQQKEQDYNQRLPSQEKKVDTPQFSDSKMQFFKHGYKESLIVPVNLSKELQRNVYSNLTESQVNTTTEFNEYVAKPFHQEGVHSMELDHSIRFNNTIGFSDQSKEHYQVAGFSESKSSQIQGQFPRNVGANKSIHGHGILKCYEQNCKICGDSEERSIYAELNDLDQRLRQRSVSRGDYSSVQLGDGQRRYLQSPKRMKNMPQHNLKSKEKNYKTQSLEKKKSKTASLNNSFAFFSQKYPNNTHKRPNSQQSNEKQNKKRDSFTNLSPEAKQIKQKLKKIFEVYALNSKDANVKSINEISELILKNAKIGTSLENSPKKHSPLKQNTHSPTKQNYLSINSNNSFISKQGPPESSAKHPSSKEESAKKTTNLNELSSLDIQKQSTTKKTYTGMRLKKQVHPQATKEGAQHRTTTKKQNQEPFEISTVNTGANTDADILAKEKSFEYWAEKIKNSSNPKQILDVWKMINLSHKKKE